MDADEVFGWLFCGFCECDFKLIRNEDIERHEEN